MNQTEQIISNGIIDCYAHIGIPRFGSFYEACYFFREWNIQKAVIVLGPKLPDYQSIFNINTNYGDFRTVGILFGQTIEQQLEILNIQIKAGIFALRLDPNETFENPEALTIAGQHNLSLYVWDAFQSKELTEIYLNWLTKYTDQKIFAFHFLRPDAILEDDSSPFIKLLKHPRFYAILARQGAMGSKEPYPYKDYLPWLHQLIKYLGWEKIMWGSEYPVFSWRNEMLNESLTWIPSLFDEISKENLQLFFKENAQRIIYTTPAPPKQKVIIPNWVQQQFDYSRTIPLFPDNLINIDMQSYSILLNEYLKESNAFKNIKFKEFYQNKLNKEN